MVAPNAVLGAGLFLAASIPLSTLIIQAAGPLAGGVLAACASLLVAAMVVALVGQSGGPRTAASEAADGRPVEP